MFSKISRYRDLPDVVVLDAKGRRLASKSLRLLPVRPGVLAHTLDGGDRLDHLAYKYYQQTRHWWHIADANEDVLSPQALVAQEPRRTVRMTLTWDGPDAPWSVLLRRLRATRDVEAVGLGTPAQPLAATEILDGPVLFTINPALTAALGASVRTQQLDAGLGAALGGQGITFTDLLRFEQVDAVTWRLAEAASRRLFTFVFFPDQNLLNVHESAPRYTWPLTVTFLTGQTAALALLALVEAEGFSATLPEEVHRVGKPIAIPARTP